MKKNLAIPAQSLAKRALPENARWRLWHLQVLPALLFIVFLWAILGGRAEAQSAASAYRYSAPSGWAQAMEGDIETLTPKGEPEGSVQLMLLAPKAASGDFRSQFESERTALEGFWGLRAPRATPLQSGKAAVGQYAAYFASYDSDAGPRFMGFMGLGNAKKFALVVFVTSGDDYFNRLAPQATQVFKSLSFVSP